MNNHPSYKRFHISLQLQYVYIIETFIVIYEYYRADICGKATILKKANVPTALLPYMEFAIKNENWGDEKTVTCVVYLQNPGTLIFEKVMMFKFTLPDCDLIKSWRV